MTLNWSEGDLIRLENASATPVLAHVGAVLALAVESTLAPALRPGGHVTSCRCISADVLRNRRLRTHSTAGVEVEQRALICPMHPGVLMCDSDDGWCIGRHLELEHDEDEDPTARCFVCSTAIPEEDVTPVFGVVQLHRPVPLVWLAHANNSGETRRITFKGELWTLPVSYVCRRHRGAVQLPLMMTWPTTFPDDEFRVPGRTF